MHNVLIKNGPYSCEKDLYLFGYTYIEKKHVEHKLQPPRQVKLPPIIKNNSN